MPGKWVEKKSGVQKSHSRSWSLLVAGGARSGDRTGPPTHLLAPHGLHGRDPAVLLDGSAPQGAPGLGRGPEGEDALARLGREARDAARSEAQRRGGFKWMARHAFSVTCYLL